MNRLPNRLILLLCRHTARFAVLLMLSCLSCPVLSIAEDSGSNRADSRSERPTDESSREKTLKPSFDPPSKVRSMQLIGPIAASDHARSVATTPDRKVLVKVETSHGDMLWLLHRDKSPITVANFLKSVRKRHYDGTVFHRSIRGFLIQGGSRGLTMEARATPESIKNEGNNGLKNVRYSIAMARPRDPDSATAEFFINTAIHNKKLDGDESKAGYTVFGEVVAGRSIVDLIEMAQTHTVLDPDFPAVAMHHVPVEPFVIRHLWVLGR